VGSVGLQSDFFAEDEAQKTEDNIDELLKRLNREEFDLVAVGRALISDPAWPAKVQSGAIDEIIPFSAESTKTLY
jgi:2,4-dienoyl-CoA reductase-like NADH-dependent reductase (Old Yellow Enzyme family)